eukprot:scaffold75398_cov67-Phaeocystis_antarctica.AAC.4
MSTRRQRRQASLPPVRPCHCAVRARCVTCKSAAGRNRKTTMRESASTTASAPRGRLAPRRRPKEKHARRRSVRLGCRCPTADNNKYTITNSNNNYRFACGAPARSTNYLRSLLSAPLRPHESFKMSLQRNVNGGVLPRHRQSPAADADAPAPAAALQSRVPAASDVMSDGRQSEMMSDGRVASLTSEVMADESRDLPVHLTQMSTRRMLRAPD